MDDPPVSVLIVNYNGAAHLPACLTGLERQSVPRDTFEVIVVDNASRDGSVELMRSQFPWVQLIPLKTNTGFAEGNNVAARHAHGRTLVLLNNDTVPDPHWLAELLRAAGRSPTGMAASKLVFAHDPTLLNSAGLILLRDGRGADRGFRQPDDGRYERTESVFAGCGAALALPAPPLGQPVFDPRYFVYSEDLDLQWRVRLAGGSILYAPRSLVRHVHGAAAGDQSPLFTFYNERNRALTALRNADPVLAVWSAAVLFAKVGQAWVQRRKTAGAVTRAAVSYLWYAPRVVAERFAVRRR